MAEPGARFYKKTNVLYDTELNAVYKDLPHGSNTTIDIKGGRDPSFNLLDVKVSSKPRFGEGEIDELRLNLYGNTITTGDSASLINLAAYGIKKGNDLGNNEGTFTLGTKDITVFGAYYGGTWLEEGFDRTISQEDLDTSFESIGNTITKKTDSYIELDDAHKNMEGICRGEDGANKISKEKMMERYGSEVEGLGRVIFVEKANWRDGEYMPKNGRRTWSNDPVWYGPDTWLNVNHATIKKNFEVQLEASVNPKQITPFNSIFDQKRTDNGYFEEKNSDGTANYIAFADVLQSTEKVASSGTSAAFDLLWKADTGDGVIGGDLKVRDHYPARCIANTATMGTNSTSDGTISGPRGRQETYISKKNIPVPIRTQSGNYSSSNNGDCMYDASIELDMNFDSLEFAHTAVFTNSGGGDGGSDGDGERKSSSHPEAGSPIHATLRRSIVFAMTDEEPDETQDLFTFLSQNYCHNWSITGFVQSASDGTSGTTHTTFTVIDTGPCGNMTNVKKGSIAIGDRVYFSHTNSHWLNHDVSLQSDGTNRYPQNGFIVTNVTTSTVTVDIKDGGDDPLSSTNTANSHSDNVGFGTVFKYSNKNFYGMAFLNMSGKTPDWANKHSSNGTYYHLSTGSTDRHIFETNHKGIIPLPFTGRSVDNSNLTASGTLDHGQSHGWVPNATTQDFVHGCQSFGDFNNDYVDRWYNRLDPSTWYTLGYHWNPNSAKCHFMVNPVGKTSDDDYLTFDSTSGDLTHPDNGHFMPNMKANTNGKLHGNLARDTSPDNWPSNMSIWGSNCSFHNQEEQSLYELNYQRASGAVSTGGTTTTATPWWMGMEDSEIGHEDGKERDTKTKVFLDKVKFNGFNLTHDNATVSLNNTFRKPITFYGGETPRMSTHYNYVLDTMASGFKPSITQLALGFDTLAHIEGAARYMLFNDFSTSNISNINALEDGTNLHIGFTSDELNGHQIAALNEDGTTLLTINRDGDNTPTVGGADGSDNRHIRVGQKVTGGGLDDDVYVTAVGDATSPTTFTISEAASGTSASVWTFSQGRANLDIDTGNNHMVTTGTNQVDKFRGKGFVKFDFVDTTAHYNDVTMKKRENIAASARVIDYIKGDDKVTKIRVDDENIFNLDEDTKYIIYLYGSAFGTAADKIIDLTVVDKEEDPDGFCTVTLSADVEDLGGTDKLSENITKGIVMISPYKYWLTLEVNKEDDAQHAYGSVLLSGGDAGGNNLAVDVDSTSPLVAGFRGATYNESIYNDTDVSGVYSPYINTRSLEFTENSDSIIELNKDYGFGAYDKEELKGGMINTLYPAEGWNEFVLDKMVEVNSDITHDDTLSFLIMPTQLESDHSASVRSKDHATASSRPYMLTGIFDPLPKPINDFKVKPNKDNAFFPEFTWSTSDSDLWYAFIKIDDKNISNQYHNAILHYPLNETGTHGSAITAPTENISGVTTTAAVATYNIEGLAGYAVNFDGASGTYIRSGTGSADPTASATSNMSVVLHAVHSTASIGADQHLLKQDEKLIIKAISGGKIEATLHADSDSFVTLTSSTLVPTDGETPINIILTFDKAIKGNNVKLFINGVLEDQTGTKVTMNNGSVSTGWQGILNVNTNNNYLYIGNAANNTSTGWVGNVEEVAIYSDTIYPVVPENNQYLFTAPISELTSELSAQSKTNVARLFVKDFHNIRGDKVTDVRASQNIAWRKAGFALDTIS